jgi:NRAMP (natural resistance-associated macrophage protein)-like metal ion transporter
MKTRIIGAYFKKLGPGLTTGAADDDPSGIATYSQAGAGYGFNFLWAAFLTYPLMISAQEMCARIGIVSGQGLAANIRERFPKKILYTITILLFVANAFNIGANLGAMSEVTKLLFPSLPFIPLILLFAFISVYLQIKISYAVYSKYLKWLALSLGTYVITAFMIAIDWSAVFATTFAPQLSFNSQTFLIISAILGTTISPYLFFWQTSQEVEEKTLSGTPLIIQGKRISQKEETKREMTNMRIDVISGMFISNVVMFFIIVVCGSTLFPQGITEIATASDAANALRPFVGDYAYLLFSIGIIGTGLLAIPVLAGSTAYAVSESMKWKSGLYRKFHEASGFYGVIIISLAFGFIFNIIGLDPIKALIYSAVANCFVAAPVLVLITLISNNKSVMGEHVNNLPTNIVAWVLVAVMSLASIATIVTLF